MNYYEHEEYVNKIKALHYKLTSLIESALSQAQHLTTGNVAHYKVGITEFLTWALNAIKEGQ